MMKRFARLARLKMMTPTSLPRIMCVLLGVAVMIWLGGCRKPTTSFSSVKPSAPPAQSSAPKASSLDLQQQASTAVTDYLKALQDEKYSAAYELLSQDSKKTHTISDFEQQGKQGMPSFDLKSAKATVDGNTAVVDVQQIDDPATHGFNLTREDGAWKIVYRGGVPGMPYPER